MAHDVSAAFIAAADAAVNDVTSDTIIGWQKQFNDDATFFELGISALDSGDFLRGSGGDVTFFDYYLYDNESENVESWEVTRNTSMFPYGVIMAQADVTLDNTSKRYLPGFDPDIGDSIKPRRPIKIFSGFDKENVQQFSGFSDIPKNTIRDRKTKIHAFDVMDYFDTLETGIKFFQNEYWHDIIEALLIEAGFNASQFELEPSTQQAIGYMPTTGMTVGEIFRKGCEAEESMLFADENGVIRHWNRFHYYQNRVPVRSFAYENLNDVSYQDSPIINYVRVKAQPRSIAALQKIWQNSSAIEVPANSSVRIPINFEDEFGALPVTTAHSPVYITNQTANNKSYYNTNTDSQGTGTANNAAISVTDFDLLGDVVFLEFTNSSAITTYITELHIYGTPAKVTSVIEEEYKDQQSMDDYGINPGNQGEIIEISNDWIQYSGTAYAHAYTMVEEYKEGNQQLVIKPFPDPSVQFGDVIQVTVDDIDLTPRECIVVGTKLKSNLSSVIAQDLIVDQRTFVPYFTLDQSQLDGTDVLAA